MSRKVQRFAKVITTPLNVHNFMVNIPGLGDQGEDLNLIVESSTFPTYKMRVVTLYTQGEAVDYPALPETQREWKTTVPESDGAFVHKIIKKLLKEIYDEKTGFLYTPKYRDVQVFARNLKDEVVFKCILHGVWFKGPDLINLANQDPTQVWKWPLNFQFSWIENPDSEVQQGSASPYEE